MQAQTETVRLVGKKQLLLVLLLVIIFSTVVWGVFAAQPKPVANLYQPSLPEASFISVASVSRRIPIRLRGTLMPEQQLRVTSPLAGQLVYISDNFRQGGEFKRGDLLFQLDDMRLRMQVAQRKAFYQQAQLDEIELQARLQSRKRSDHDALSQLAKGEPQLSAASAHTVAAKAAWTYAKLQLEKTRYQAPFDGKVRQVQAHLHEYLAAGAPIASLYGSKHYRLRLAVSDSNRALLDLTEVVGSEVVITAPEQPDKQWLGRVVAYDGYVDEGSRQSYVIVEFDSEDKTLAPGQLMDAVLNSRRFDNLFVIESRWMRNDHSVWLLADDDTLIRRKVNIVARDARQVYLNAGLNTGERLIVSPLLFVSAGMKLKPLTTAPSLPLKPPAH